MHVDDLKIVVSCPIKNDNEYLIEFVEHYLNLGFNAIYLYTGLNTKCGMNEA